MWNSNKLKFGSKNLWIIPLTLLAVSHNSSIAKPFEWSGSAVGLNVIQQTIRGVVKDGESGKSIAGASIIVNGVVKGQTDNNGQFTIDASIGQTLKVSYVGYNATELRISSTNISVSLVPDASSLDEVVVVGYGTMRKSDVTGSISMVKGEDMTKAQNFSAVENLRGKAAGVNIYSNSSQPGAYGNRVIIRGTSTINASSNPLYVVDGVVMESFHLLNPNDIERVEVLKDASSTAIYGARGANGVILVTTKRGNSNGNQSISYLGSAGVSSPARYMDVLSGQQWVDAFMIGLENENKYQGKSWSLNKTDWFNDPNYFDNSGNPLYSTNWQKEATRTSFSQNHQINIQQGGNNSSVGAFLNYTDNQGIMNNTFAKRVNGKLAYDAKPKEWLSTSINLLVNHTWSRYTPEDGGGQDARRTMIEMLPWLPVRESNGDYTNSTSSTINNVLGFEGMSNPVAILDLQKRMKYNTKIFGNAAFTFHLAEGLDLKTQIGVDNQRDQFKGYSSILLNNISKPNGWAEIRNEDVLYWQEETYLTYNKSFDKHRLNLMGGMSWQGRTYDYSQSRTEGFDSDFYEWYNMGVGKTPSPPQSNWDKWTMNSYFVRAAYSYDNRYSATLTGRYDGSSKFGANNKYAFFPSAGFAWNVSNEDFLSGNEKISNLKLHTSYGFAGNSEISPYRSLANISAGTILQNGSRVPFSFVGTMPNRNLKWERTGQFDVGVELGLFQNRLSFDVSFYNKVTKDLLLDAPVPSSTGFSSIFKNIGSVQNRGLDILINAYPIKNDSFSWSTTLNMNYNKNKVLKLGNNNEDIQRMWWVGGANQIIRVGQDLYSFYGYVREGVYTIQDYEAGTAKLEQIGRAKRSSDKKILGKGTPDWSGSFINTVNYKNFDLTLDLQFVYGVETMQQFYHSVYDRFGITNGLTEVLTDAYNGSNPNTMQQAIYLTNSGHAGQDTNVDSSWIVNGSYLRVNLLQLGYTFKPEALRALKLNGIRLFASASNPWLLTSKDFKGYDPESTSQGDQFGQNITFFSYPRAKTFTFGLNINF